jgi:hypothetical protein
MREEEAVSGQKKMIATKNRLAEKLMAEENEPQRHRGHRDDECSSCADRSREHLLTPMATALAFDSLHHRLVT